jgi:ceramide glucosyltransferase
VGLVNSFYRLANPQTLAMQWEAIAVNADFWSQVLQARSLKPLDFALGAVMIVRRSELNRIGGFTSLAQCLADDYQLGNRIASLGRRIELCPVVVECWNPPMYWRQVWNHQLRWARTVRVCQPVPYFFSILSNASLWPILWLAVGVVSGHVRAAPIVACCALRTLLAADLQRRLTGTLAHLRYAWLAPLKDLLQAALWVCAFAGNRIEWRGRQFTLRRDGTLVSPSAGQIDGDLT